jgi:hypothetical protein
MGERCNLADCVEPRSEWITGMGSTPTISFAARSAYAPSCELLDNGRGRKGVDSIGAILQQDGDPESAVEGASLCVALTSSCAIQQA